MGRRARTNCSPIDSAMEKYHNDIGNRLSGVFIPTLPTADGENLSKDFCMLTLDTRHLSSLKNKVAEESATSPLREEPDNQSDAGSDMSTSTTSCVSTFTCTPSEQDDMPKDKLRLVDRLTRALFQKKHTCNRCKRRSRSCTPNKTFSGTDKHYMCGRCRESSHAIKSLFGDKKHSNDSGIPSQPFTSVLTSQNKSHAIPMPRTHLNDSGYETVTSCSTVASSYSAFNSPATTNSNANKDNVAADSTHTNQSQDNGPRRNSKDTSAKCDPTQPCVCTTGDATSDNDANSTELYQFMGVGQNGSPTGVLRQVKHKNVKNYDGYLPDVDYQGWGRNDHPALADATNFDDQSENGEFNGVIPRIINVSKPGKQTSTAAQKACYTCESTSKPCFRLPWKGGWICEDCLDGLY